MPELAHDFQHMTPSEIVRVLDSLTHRSLVAATDSPRLLRLFELLEDEIRLATAQLRPAYASPTELAREHRRLLTVVETGTATEAVRLMQQHLDQAVGDLTTTARRSGRTKVARRREG